MGERGGALDNPQLTESLKKKEVNPEQRGISLKSAACLCGRQSAVIRGHSTPDKDYLLTGQRRLFYVSCLVLLSFVFQRQEWITAGDKKRRGR